MKDETNSIKERSDKKKNNEEEGHRPTWGRNSRKKVEASSWGTGPMKETREWRDTEGDERRQRDERSNSPSNLHYRFTNCQFCEEQLVTRIAHNGQLTCRQCTLWIANSLDDNETGMNAEVTQAADHNETQTSE